MKQTINAIVIFFDNYGHNKDEVITAQNTNQLESTAHLLAEDLAKKWGHPVRWRKRNPDDSEAVILKVKIDNDKEQEFINFLNEEGLYFKKTKYTQDLYVWRVELPLTYEEQKLRDLEYIIRVEPMEQIYLD